MGFGSNGRLRTNSVLREIANNNRNDVIDGTDAAEAFSFTNINDGLSGDDTIRRFGKNDVLLNYRTIYDGNADNLIELGANGLLDIDRTGPGKKRAGADQIALEGLDGGALRYLGDKRDGTATVSVYADASVRLKGLTEGTVNDDAFDAAGKNRQFFYDTALGLNLGGDTIRNFGADDRIVTTTAFFDGTGGNGAITAGANGVFDLSGTVVNMRGDDGANNGGQIDIVGVSALYLQSTSVVNGVSYYSYGTAATTPPPANRAPTASATLSIKVDEDRTAGAVAIGARDPDGDTLAYSIKANAGAAKGSVVFDQQAGTFSYTPGADRNGADAFTILISDGRGGTTEQRVSVTITPVQDAIAPVRLADIAAGRGGFQIVAENSGDHAGFSVSAAGDVNGDGFDDIIVGAYGEDQGRGYEAGAAYVIFGKAGGNVDLDAVKDGTGGFKITGQLPSGRVGIAVSGAGDVNGDGLADVIVGADRGGVYAGAAYVIFGKADSGTVDLDAVAGGAGGFRITGQAPDDQAGASVSGAGDINRDGLDDLIVGAPYRNDGGPYTGVAYVVFGKADGGTIDLNAVAAGEGGFKIIGQAEGNLAGFAVSDAGDVNGDGWQDLIVGAPGVNGETGAAYVVFGQAGSGTVDLNAIAAGEGGFAINGTRTSSFIGYAVSRAGDVNGDGFDDLIVGAPTELGAGSAYVVFGKADGGAVDLGAVANGTGGFKINGGSDAGFSVSDAGDLNGDGLADLIVGSRMNREAYAVFGKADTATVELSKVKEGIGGFVMLGDISRTGVSVSNAGDVNHDGLADLLVGADNSSASATYVIFGTTDWLI